MARSWDQRVKGATEKEEAAAPEEKWDASKDGATIVPAMPLAWDTSFDALPIENDPAVVANGLSHAISSAGIPIVVVDRSSSEILWASGTWVERFGGRDRFSQHTPTSTDLGEAPLPPPGENWQRTRTLIRADGSEDLTEMVLLGSNCDSNEIVTVMARDRLSSTPSVSDRSEVIGVIDGLVAEAEDNSIAILYLDIDRFKVVHDLVGNLEASRILDGVGRRVAATVREGDLLFQLPGDEFVVLAANLEGLFEAEELAERLRSTVAMMSGNGQEMAVTASVGVAFCRAGRSGDALLSDAETAVYVAKGRGRNRVAIHDEEVRSRSDRILTVERQLRRAIDRKQVKVAYQPLVDLVANKMVGAEALLRLGGEVGLSAVEVVAAAEQNGLMGDLGKLVVAGVSDQFGDWLASDESRLLMINLSANQIEESRFIDTLMEIVNSPGLVADRMAIEVPESVAIENLAAFAELSVALRPKVRIGIDGFGIRFTSLAEIGSLNVDYVKLHRSITSMFGADGELQSRAANIVSSVSAAGISVVALGVEREQQIDELVRSGCHLAQGFFFAGALSSSELRTFQPEPRSIEESAPGSR